MTSKDETKLIGTLPAFGTENWSSEAYITDVPILSHPNPETEAGAKELKERAQKQPRPREPSITVRPLPLGSRTSFGVDSTGKWTVLSPPPVPLAAAVAIIELSAPHQVPFTPRIRRGS